MPKDHWNKAKRKKTGQRVNREFREESKKRGYDAKEFLEGLHRKPDNQIEDLEELAVRVEAGEYEEQVCTLPTTLYVELFVKPVLWELDRRTIIVQIAQQALDLATIREYLNDPANCY